MDGPPSRGFRGGGRGGPLGPNMRGRGGFDMRGRYVDQDIKSYFFHPFEVIFTLKIFFVFEFLSLILELKTMI